MWGGILSGRGISEGNMSEGKCPTLENSEGDDGDVRPRRSLSVSHSRRSRLHPTPWYFRSIHVIGRFGTGFVFAVLLAGSLGKM